MDEKVRTIEGWMLDDELDWLEKTAASFPSDALIVELGAWKGRSTSAIATSMRQDVTFVTVDTWLGQPDLRTTAHREVIQNDIFLEFLNNMRKFNIFPSWYSGKKGGIYYIRSESTLAPLLFQNESVDWIFIDSDHTKFGEDIDAWYRKIKPGGIISGHDYTWGGAKEAIDDRVMVCEVINSVWWGYKK